MFSDVNWEDTKYNHFFLQLIPVLIVIGILYGIVQAIRNKDRDMRQEPSFWMRAFLYFIKAVTVFSFGWGIAFCLTIFITDGFQY